MKKSFIAAAFLFGTFTAPATFSAGADFETPPAPPTAAIESADEDIIAAAGCCKERASQGKPWRRTKRSFDSCKQVNGKSKEDRDNVFKPTGRYWWDVAC